MLVLTRRVGESVVISEEVYCTVVGYKDGEVRLAFDAPKSIVIHRHEIQRRIEKEACDYPWRYEKKPNRESVVDRLIRKFKYRLSFEKRRQVQNG